MMTSGTILVEKDTLRPSCFQLEDDPTQMRLDASHPLSDFVRTRKRGQRPRGRSSFTWPCSDDDRLRIRLGQISHAALSRLITNTKLQECNSLEIDAVTLSEQSADLK